MTTDSAITQFDKLITTINFHVQNKELREQLVAFLNLDFIKSRLLTAPASSQHHQAEAGGLLLHTNDVIRYAHLELEHWNSIFSIPNLAQNNEDVAVAGTIHDLSKLGDPIGRNFYVPNILKSGKVSEAKPYERSKDAFKCANLLAHSLLSKPSTDVSDVSKLAAAVGELLDRNIGSLREGELSLLLVNSLAPELYKLLSPEVRSMVRLHDGAYAGRGDLNGHETVAWFALHTADMLSSREVRWHANLSPAAA